MFCQRHALGSSRAGPGPCAACVRAVVAYVDEGGMPTVLFRGAGEDGTASHVVGALRVSGPGVGPRGDVCHESCVQHCQRAWPQHERMSAS